MHLFGNFPFHWGQMCPCALCQSVSLLLVCLLKYSSAFLASPHQHYNLPFHSCSFSLLTFQFFPVLSLAISSPCSLSSCLVHLSLCLLCFFCFPPPLFHIFHSFHSSPIYHCFLPLHATRLLVPISHCVWLVHPVSSRFQHLQEMSREL